MKVIIKNMYGCSILMSLCCSGLSLYAMEGLIETPRQVHIAAAAAAVEAGVQKAVQAIETAQAVTDVARTIEHLAQAGVSLHEALTKAASVAQAVQAAQTVQAGTQRAIQVIQAVTEGSLAEMRKIEDDREALQQLLKEARHEKAQQALQVVQDGLMKVIQAANIAQQATGVAEKVEAAAKAQKAVGEAFEMGLKTLRNK